MNRNNEQKNTYVKKQITLALLELLKEKPLVDISISELTQKAQIGRVSFYRNYQTKEDILREESDRLLKEWGKLYEENPASSPGTLFPSLFDFYREHKEFYTILYQAPAGNHPEHHANYFRNVQSGSLHEVLLGIWNLWLDD